MKKLQVIAGRVCAGGNPVMLRGVNLGNWLNVEDFMIGLSGTDWQIKAMMDQILGPEVRRRFFQSFVGNYITESDIAFIAMAGFNHVRIPFNYRYFESDAHTGDCCSEATFSVIDRLFDCCERHGLHVLLDFHAAPGGQNTTPPADNAHGLPLFWSEKHCQDQCVALWEEMARRYARRSNLIGYNLLNEPITDQYGPLTPAEQTRAMNGFFAGLISAIRAIDPESCVVVEGPVRQSGGIALLDKALFREPNMIASFHYYPMFQLDDLPGLNIGPAELANGARRPDRDDFKDTMRGEHDFIRATGCPMLLGEFGFFSNKEPLLQNAMVRLQLDIMKEWGWHWCLWSYKDIGLMGLVTPRPDTGWMRFVGRREVQTRNRRGFDEYGKYFESVVSLYGKTEATRPHFDYAYNNALRGLRVIQLYREIEDLKALGAEDILRLPESFHFDQCDVNATMIGILGEYLD